MQKTRSNTAFPDHVRSIEFYHMYALADESTHSAPMIAQGTNVFVLTPKLRDAV